MFGVFLISIGQFFSEISDSIIKDRGQRDESLLYALGFLQLIWGELLFLGIAFLAKARLFSSRRLCRPFSHGPCWKFCKVILLSCPSSERIVALSGLSASGLSRFC